MEVLITSKTRKGKMACVGGMILKNNRNVRLLNNGNWDQPIDTEFNIGDIWDISFEERTDKVPPHIEDVIITSKKFVRKIENISEFIKNSGVKIYEGSPENLFDGLIRWTFNGSGFINKSEIPQCSVAFWIPDKNLNTDSKYYYYISEKMPIKVEKEYSFITKDNKVIKFIHAGGIFTFKLKYVGFEEPIRSIPAGTLLRVSLARWWKPDDKEVEERCYLQLSGWYDL